MQQFVFSVLACGVAAGTYFLLRDHVGTETVSWICILCAAPFVALGFIRYHSMSIEQFICAWIKSEFLFKRILIFDVQNVYYEILRPSIYKCEKEELKRHD